MGSKRLLFATVVPFWKNSTGAQQRILHLVQGLSGGIAGHDSHTVKTFYIGQNFDDMDLATVQRLGLDVEHHQSGDPSTSNQNRIRWHLEGTIHLVRQAYRGQDKSNDASKPVVTSDYRWPWAMRAFASCVEAFEPDGIVCQYITMGYLLDALSAEQRKRIRCVVDAHDILHERQKQFAEFGFEHWLSIDHDEEALELRRFDAILSIIESETPQFQLMAPNADVLTVGHSIEPVLESTGRLPERTRDGILRVGFLGSGNASNGHAIIKFIRQSWRRIRQSNDSIRLVIAGGVCDWLMFHEENRFEDEDSMSLRVSLAGDRQVDFLGTVDSVSEFYSQVDLAINPVEFGTGLKIKTCEACAFGIPSMMTHHGVQAIPPEAEAAFVVVDSVQAMGGAIVDLIRNPASLEQLHCNAETIGREVFSDQRAYGDLFQWLAQ